MISSARHFLTIFAALLGVLVLFPTYGFAQNSITEPEDIALAFFKTANAPPDFDLWARKTNGYKVVAPAFAADYIRDEKQRLMQKWRAYDPQKNMIEIRLEAPVHLQRKMSEEDDGREEFWMNITLPDMELLYFPYKFQDYQFAVMPENLEKLTLHPLHSSEYELLRATFDGKEAGLAYLYLQLSPTKAYADEPYDIDGAERWALITVPVRLTLNSTRTDAAVWSYTAPWYSSPVQQKIEGLYQGDTPR